MSLTVGTRIGPYEVQSPLGEGGMGVVFRAYDTRLGRDVAIKALPAAFANEPDRLSRFQREAQALASLNHPHIAHIYGLEYANGTPCIVMELVEGETLASRLKRGPLPVDEALNIAKQIAEALEAAHEKGIVHRDLKPANVMALPDGQVKVLDFGLAKALDSSPAGTNLSNSPTLSMGATNAGVIFGTAAYMSPEQAKGLTVDRRTDIFAFGAVFYEMLTGRPAFAGETAGDILAAVIRGEPDWNRLPEDTPSAIRRLLRRCLEKDRTRRLQTAADARIRIEEAGTDPEPIPLPLGEGAAPKARRVRAAWFAAIFATAALLLAIPAFLYFRSSPPPDAPEMRVDINTPATGDAASFALSPDGRQLVFVASGDGPSRLWLRPLGTASAQPLAGTEGAAYPFWSPDSRSIGFSAGGKLKRLDLGGGQPQILTDAADRGGTWNADGVILFARTTGSPLSRVSDSGGEAAPVTKLDRQTSHRFPYFLPDGRHFLFFAQGTPETIGIYLASLDSEETKRLMPADGSGVYMPSGWLLWVRAGRLMAQRLDLGQRTLAGDAVTVADSVGSAAFFFSALSVSATGLVAYRPGGASQVSQLTWFDRSGKALGTVGAPDENISQGFRVSPDGRVAVTRTVQSNSDIWMLDAVRMSRFTFDQAFDRTPSWSPDGSRIVFDSNRKGPRNLYIKSSSGADGEELLLESPQNKRPSDWSADGRFIIYDTNNPQTDWDLWVLPMSGAREAQARQGAAVGNAIPAGRSQQNNDGDRKPWIFLKTNFAETSGRFSPDGRWVAYESNESGRVEIYIRPFAKPGDSGAVEQTTGQWQVSTAGGINPRWRPDGKELYFIGPNGEMMAAPITATGTTIEPGAPGMLFPTRFGSGTGTWEYDVARDGRFLINKYLDDAISPITLLLNWHPERGK